jgi:hypothetical protein
MTLLSNSHDALPQIYLITDGSVDDERNICHTVKTQLMSKGPKSPRISTFGLGNISCYIWLYITVTGQAKLYWQISVGFLESCTRYNSAVLHHSIEIYTV